MREWVSMGVENVGLDKVTNIAALESRKGEGRTIRGKLLR